MPDGSIDSSMMCSQAVVERVLGDSSVTSIKIFATLESDNFVAGTSGWQINRVTGSAEFQDVIVRGTLNADDITVGTLVADRIAAGSLDADKITAGTITTDRLIIGSFDNLISNPGLETGTLAPHSVVDSSTGTWSISANPRSGAKSLRYFFGSSMSVDARVALNGSRTDIGDHPSVAEGDVLYFTMWARDAGPPNGTTNVRAAIFFYDETGTQVGSVTYSSTVDVSGYQQLEVSATAPAGAAYVVFEPNVLAASTATTGAVHFDDFYARRKVGTAVIEDGAITADKLTVTSLDAITAAMGTLTVDSTLTMGAGGVIRTAASGSRIEMTKATFDRINFYTGNASEASSGDILAGYAGVVSTGYLFLEFHTPQSTTNSVEVRLNMKAESADSTSQAPEVLFSVQGSPALQPLFKIGQFLVRADTGSASFPTYSYDTDPDTGMYLGGTNLTAIATGGGGRIYWDVNGTHLLTMPTTETAANVYANNAQSNRLYRQTSARKYKKRINYNVDYLADYDLRPTKHWRPDDKRWFYSFVADDLGEQDKLLGVYGPEGIENFDTRAVMAVMAAKINRLEKLVAA